jgi:hypothetical protein
VLKEESDNVHIAIRTGIVEGSVLFDGGLGIRVCTVLTEDLDYIDKAFEGGLVERRPAGKTLNVDCGPPSNELSYKFGSALGSSLMQQRFTGFRLFIQLGIDGLGGDEWRREKGRIGCRGWHRGG